MSLHRHGLSVTPPAGWDVRIYRREPGPGETTHAVLHAATTRLPAERGDYGSNVVAGLGVDDAFVALLEFDPAETHSALFTRRGCPPVRPRDFSPRQLHRVLPGQSGVQSFFSVRGRAFALYVVLGAHARRLFVVPRVQELVGAIRVDPR